LNDAVAAAAAQPRPDSTSVHDVSTLLVQELRNTNVPLGKISERLRRIKFWATFWSIVTIVGLAALVIEFLRTAPARNKAAQELQQSLQELQDAFGQ
jgi:hypothetical protein